MTQPAYSANGRKPVELPAVAKRLDRRTVLLASGKRRPLTVEVVAEGVETTERRDLLIELGYTHAQGYLFGRPTDPDLASAAL